ncbi:cyclic nucleotide-binding domain-containing protein [Haliovirga abyssi]|uniref:Cyclic nucleotide-binding domain-containing protein n=1 Tax=Haliovirga abyssi TaxID=2996794 RepID=A0AAU9DEW9_9FUSO|nr:cyclic nucleotide-binding domain-containing protein [Haliovirga abyssi]BDU50927.1 hypothetical protein HLVA_14960 [Haliovirga abyssi]
MATKIDINMFLISLLIIVLIYFTFIIINIFIKSKLKTNRLRNPLILILIGVSTKIFFTFNILNVNMKVINSIIYSLILFSTIKILDYMFKEIYFVKLNNKVPKLMNDIATGIIYFVTFFMILKIELGIDLTPLLTTSAVLSMVIGLALQDTLTNFISGIVINLEKPFKIGDWVLVNEVEGKVVETNWRTTKILTFDNDFLIIPNGNIVKNSIINFYYPTTSHILNLYLGTSYNDPPNKVKKVILDVIKDIKGILLVPLPQIRLIKYNDFSVDYEVRIWISDYGNKKTIENSLMTHIWYAFRREGIKIPYPIRESYIHRAQDNIKYEVEIKKHDILKEIEFFNRMNDEILEKISNKLEKIVYGKNETIVKQGNKGDSFYIIYSGEVSVLIDTEKVAELKKGDFFGEMSLFTGKEITATVVALEDVELLKLNKESFSEIIKENKELAEMLSDIITKRELENEEKKIGNLKLGKKTEREKKRIADKKKKGIFDNIVKFFNL